MWWHGAVLAALLLQTANPAADGMKALNEQRWEAAADSFAKAAAAEPGDYSHHFNLAFALSMLHRDADAVAEYRKTLDLKPGLMPAELNLGILLLRQKQPKEAVPLLESVVKQKPGCACPAQPRRAPVGAGDAEGSAAAFSAALSIDPSRPPLNRDWPGRSARARSSPRLRRTSARRPPSIPATATASWSSRRCTSKRSNSPRRSPLPEFPDNPAAKERLGELLLESGKAADAIPSLEAAVEKSPTAANRYALANSYMAQQQFDKAAVQLEGALRAEPGNLHLQLDYARALRSRHNIRMPPGNS